MPKGKMYTDDFRGMSREDMKRLYPDYLKMYDMDHNCWVGEDHIECNRDQAEEYKARPRNGSREWNDEWLEIAICPYNPKFEYVFRHRKGFKRWPEVYVVFMEYEDKMLPLEVHLEPEHALQRALTLAELEENEEYEYTVVRQRRAETLEETDE